MGQQQTHVPQQSLFNYLVGAGGSVGTMVRPSAFAVLRLIASSNFVACRTGRSAGFAPLRMRRYIDAGQTKHPGSRRVRPVYAIWRAQFSRSEINNLSTFMNLTTDVPRLL